MDPNHFQTHDISLHEYSVSHPVTRLVVGLLVATYLASVTQWYSVQYALSIGEPFNHAHNICCGICTRHLG